MKRLLATSILTVLMFAIPMSVAAQVLPHVGQAMGGTDGNDVVYTQKTNYDFEGDEIKSELIKPAGENFPVTRHGKTSSLIKIRGGFIPELLKSVEDI